jgi:hypothetical protein
MEKINKFVNKTVTILTIISITILWFLAMAYSVQVTVFNH